MWTDLPQGVSDGRCLPHLSCFGPEYRSLGLPPTSIQKGLLLAAIFKGGPLDDSGCEPFRSLGVLFGFSFTRDPLIRSDSDNIRILCIFLDIRVVCCCIFRRLCSVSRLIKWLESVTNATFQLIKQFPLISFLFSH